MVLNSALTYTKEKKISKISQAKKIIKLLQDNPNERFSARDIAEKIVSIYPQDYEETKNNPRFQDEKSFISQIVAEIGSQKDQLTKSSEHIFWQDKPRPRVYWYDPDKKINFANVTVKILSKRTQELEKIDELLPLQIKY